MDFDVKDIKLASDGLLKIRWAENDMPVLRGIKSEFEKNRPLKGVAVGACLHVTSETANLMITLKSWRSRCVALRFKSAKHPG